MSARAFLYPIIGGVCRQRRRAFPLTLIVVATVTALAACADPGPPEFKCELEIALTHATLELVADSSVPVAAMLPACATGTRLRWSVTDSSVLAIVATNDTAVLVRALDPGVSEIMVGTADTVLGSVTAVVRELPRDLQAPLQTDRLAYEFSAGADGFHAVRIALEWQNPLPDTVWWQQCLKELDVRVERNEGGGWISVWFPVLRLCSSPPIAIPPDGTHGDSLVVWGRFPGTGNAPPQLWERDRIRGRYRLVWNGLSLHPDGVTATDTLDTAYRASNMFRLGLQ